MLLIGYTTVTLWSWCFVFGLLLVVLRLSITERGMPRLYCTDLNHSSYCLPRMGNGASFLLSAFMIPITFM